MPSAPSLPVVLDATEIERAWFDAPPPSSRRRASTPPPSSVEPVGAFLGDPLADSWLR